MKLQQFNKGLTGFIQHSPTPFHAVHNMKTMLESNGFKQLYERDSWKLAAGKYYVTRNASSIIAFVVPKDKDLLQGMHMAGAHTDSPCLKLKPAPVIKRHGYLQLGAEIYGGVLLNPWFDRDLSLAGRVTCVDKKGNIKSELIDFRRPVAMIPSLAIHLDRNANQERSVNAQTDVVPLAMRQDESSPGDLYDVLARQLKEQHAKLKFDRVLDFELSFYDVQAPALTGFNEEFICSARLDNLVSCFVGLQALVDADASRLSLLVCNDHEEVGSASSSGAQGPFLKSVLERLSSSREDLTRLIDRSVMISCDNAHGIHPNFSSKHDDNHGPLLNSGPVIKTNANQRYASNSETNAYFRQLCRQLDIPVQDFVTRADMACGSTIGPITATEIGVKTIDVGVPQLAMHSIRETCGSKDPWYLYRVIRRHYGGG